MAKADNHDEPDKTAEDTAGADSAASGESAPYRYGKAQFRSVPLVIAAALVALEGIALVGWAATWAYLTITDSPTDETASILGAAFVLFGGLILLRMALALWQTDVWPRIPVVVFQLCFVPVAASLIFQAHNYEVGVPLMVVALALLALLFSRPVREVYGREV